MMAFSEKKSMGIFLPESINGNFETLKLIFITAQVNEENMQKYN